ncbi:hypothetical protein MTO96_016507 [Rhipicephalus appendiculatus]
MTDADAVSLKSQQRRRHASSARDEVIGIAGVALYVLLSPATDASAEETPPTPDAVCYSPSCLATSEMLRENLNPLVAPCDDFQGYVCSRFMGPAQSLLLSELQSAMGRVVQSLRNLDESVRGARRKAADMFRACERRYRSEYVRSTRKIRPWCFKELMARLRLSISGPLPEGSLSTPDGLLKLHVELAFVYELSGLFFLRPAMPQSIRVAADLSFIHASEEYAAPDMYFKDLLHAIDPENTELADQGLALHNTMTLAVAAATSHRHGSTSARRFVKVRDVSFRGVSDGAFAAAVEERTPYKRDSNVELDAVVPGALGVCLDAGDHHRPVPLDELAGPGRMRGARRPVRGLKLRRVRPLQNVLQARLPGTGSPRLSPLSTFDSSRRRSRIGSRASSEASPAASRRRRPAGSASSTSSPW